MFKINQVFSTVAIVTMSLTGAASAEVIVFDNASLFASVADAFGQAVINEDFSAYDGYYASGISGGAGQTAWTATSNSGFLASDGVFSTNVAADALTFTFASTDVYSVGGNFFNRDADFNALPSIIRLTTSSGVSYIHFVGSSATFSGFVSTSDSIQSISITPFGASAGRAFSAVSTMTFGVIPAPGAVALLAMGGLIRRRRR